MLGFSKKERKARYDGAVLELKAALTVERTVWENASRMLDELPAQEPARRMALQLAMRAAQRGLDADDSTSKALDSLAQALERIGAAAEEGMSRVAQELVEQRDGVCALMDSVMRRIKAEHG